MDTILQQRIAGATYRELGEQAGLTTEGARKAARREATAHINHLITEMWAAQKQGELLTLAVPGDDPADQRNAAAYLHWLLDEFAERGLNIATHYRPAIGADGLAGVCFAIEDLDFQPGGN